MTWKLLLVVAVCMMVVPGTTGWRRYRVARRFRVPRYQLAIYYHYMYYNLLKMKHLLHVRGKRASILKVLVLRIIFLNLI
jgi:hypothetical protein